MQINTKIIDLLIQQQLQPKEIPALLIKSKEIIWQLHNSQIKRLAGFVVVSDIPEASAQLKTQLVAIAKRLAIGRKPA